jgi:hypothetical protein
MHFVSRALLLKISIAALGVLLAILGYRFYQDTTKTPVLLLQSLYTGQVDTPVGATLSFTFSTQIKLPDVTISPPVPLQVSLSKDKKTVQISPASSFAFDSSYLVSLSKLKSTWGKTGANFSLIFYTPSLPVVLSTQPQQNSQNVSPLAEVVFTLDKPIQVNSFKVTSLPETTLSVELTNGGRDITVSPATTEKNWETNTQYTLTLSPLTDEKNETLLKTSTALVFSTTTLSAVEASQQNSQVDSTEFINDIDTMIAKDPYLRLVNNTLPYTQYGFRIQYLQYTDLVTIDILHKPADYYLAAAKQWFRSQGITNPDGEKFLYSTYVADQEQ